MNSIPQTCDRRDIPQTIVPCTPASFHKREKARTSHGVLLRTGVIWFWLSIKSCVTMRSRILQQLATTSGHGIEDRALSLLALRNSGADPQALLDVQHRSGAWSAFPNIESLSAFHTSLTLLAIRPFQTRAVRHAADRSFDWLSELRGLESHWLWQWKFRLFDKQVRFDPAKSGWPWAPGTVSWVAPTALSLLAFQAWRRESPRIAPAIAMLLDRACPQGGWNAGALAPWADTNS
jgi:hypothetical protein